MSVKLEMRTSAEEILETLAKLNKEQGVQRVTQRDICEHIKNKISLNSTMNLLQEEVLEDGSVLLTINM